LGRRQVIEAQGRHFGHAELVGGQQASFPGDHIAVAIDQDRHNKAKGLDAFGDLPDLLFAVAPRVCRVPFELVERAVDDLQCGG